jgi:hypothetical protein
MCPACALNAVLAVASATTSGGIASLAVRIFRFKRNARKSGLKEITQRRREYGYTNEQAGPTESRAAG